MTEQMPQQPQQAGYVDPLQTNVGYIPNQKFELDPTLSKHLDSTDMLNNLNNMLMGLEYDSDEDIWKPVMVLLGYDEDGKKVMEEEGPLMEPKDVRITMSFLRSLLNQNTFLSQLDDDRINDIMFDVSIKLGILFYNLRYKLSTEARTMIWGALEYPILFALSRANKKITLDAISKMQQTHEIIQTSPKPQQQENKDFKVLGW